MEKNTINKRKREERNRDVFHTKEKNIFIVSRLNIKLLIKHFNI